MQPDAAVDLLTKTKTSLTNYRRTGFASVHASAKDMCEDINVEAVLKEKRLSTKRHFAFEDPDESTTDTMIRLQTTFHNVVVDIAI